jgi:monoamine oxidase
MEPGGRQVMHAVDGGVLYFSGEHTNVYNNAALQGAMESGRRAAADVAAALQKREEL